MTIAECLKNWDDESTLKWVLAKGIPPKKWKAYALHAGVVDGHSWTYEEIVQNGKLGIGKTRARICQIVKEVESALTEKLSFSPLDPHCRRAANNFLTWIRPERATSAYRLGSSGCFKPDSNTVFVCGDKKWKYCDESVCVVSRRFDPPLNIDLSWISDKRNRPYFGKTRYAVVWCTGGNVVGTTCGYACISHSRYWLLVFYCDGEFYEFDHEETDAGGMKRIFLKPLECSVVRAF